MFAVMGVTGNTGGAVAEALLARGAPVRVVVRDAAKAAAYAARGAEIAVADAGDAEALARAFDGTHAIYAMNPPQPLAPDFHAAADVVTGAIARAVAAADTGHVVMLSSYGAHLPAGTGVVTSLNRMEGALAAAGKPLTRLRPCYFMTNLLSSLPLARGQGIFPSLVRVDLAYPMVAAGDIGLAAADLLMSAGSQDRLVHLEGPARHSAGDVAAILSRLLEREVTAVVPPREQWQAILEGSGVSTSYAAGLIELADAIAAETVLTEGGAEPRRGTIGLEQVLREALSDG